MQHVGGGGAVVRILIPIAGNAAAHGNGAANRLRVGKHIAVVGGAGLRKSQQEYPLRVGVVFPHGKLDDRFQVPVVELDGILHLVRRAPAKDHAKVLGILDESAKKLERALQGNYHHVAVRDVLGHPHHGIFIPFVTVHGHQQRPTLAPGVVVRQLNFVVAADGAAKEFFHRFSEGLVVASFPSLNDSRSGRGEIQPKSQTLNSRLPACY